MELVFALITYIGINKVDESYFRNINDCRYFAVRINKNPPVPGVEKPEFYTAVCKPVKVNKNKAKVY